jgi:glycosyltransferase involved in cell wall biosynthesis
LRAELTARQPQVVTLHYSTLAWSRRGLPFAFIALTSALRLRYRVLVWAHDPLPNEPGWKGALRRTLKSAGLLAAALIANATAVSIRPEMLRWARSRFVARKLVYCASPTNIAVSTWRPPDDLFTVATFGIAVGTEAHEAGPFAVIARALREKIGPFRLRLLGARTTTEKPPLATELEALGIECDVPGYLEPDELANRLAASHVFLSVRYELSTRSGTVAAALACGLPIVGVAGAETSEQLASTAVTRPLHDWTGIANAIATLAATPSELVAMSARSTALSVAEYSWEPGVAILRTLAAR